MSDSLQQSFLRIIDIIQNSRDNLYWKIGEFLSLESENSNFGDAYILFMADYIQSHFPGIKGFNKRGLYRMKQFYEIYKNDEFVSTLLTQISWSNHLHIMSKAKSTEERHFYIMLCIKEHYSARELERQINSAYYERYMLSNDKISSETLLGNKENAFLDSYVLEFLNLPQNYREKDLQKALIENFHSQGSSIRFFCISGQRTSKYHELTNTEIASLRKDIRDIGADESRTLCQMLLKERKRQE